MNNITQICLCCKSQVAKESSDYCTDCLTDVENLEPSEITELANNLEKRGYKILEVMELEEFLMCQVGDITYHVCFGKKGDPIFYNLETEQWC